MKKFSLLFFILFTILFGFSQSNKVDSLKNKLKTTKEPKEKLNIYDALVKAYINKDIDKSQAYNDTLKKYSQSLNNKKMEMTSIYNNSSISRQRGDLVKGKKQAKTFLSYAISSNDSIEISKANYQLGSINVYLDEKEAAILNFLEALNYLDKNKNESQKAKILNGIAIIYSQTSQYEKSKEYNRKVIDVALKLKDSSLLAISYNGRGITLKNQDSIKKALYYFKKSLNIAEKTNNTRVMGYQYRNIGIIHSIKKDYKQAEPFLEKALMIRRQMKDKSTIGGSLSDLANVYIETDRLDRAEKYLNEAIAIFKNNKTISNENTMYYYLSTLEAKRGNAEKALEFSDRYYTTRDSLQNIDLQEKINDIDIKYQTEKKDKTILENELKLEKSQAKTQTMTILIISLLLASILLWFIFQQRQKRIQQQLVTIQKEQEVRTLESLIIGEEKERLRIAKELHDGVNGDLSAIKFKLSSLLKMNNEIINQAVTMIDNSCQQVRAISHNLVPPSLKNFSLFEAVSNYCENMDSIHEPEIRFQSIGDPINLNKKIEINIFRIIQELVTNAVKHAEAKTIDIQISNSNDVLLVTVEDDGKGYTSHDLNDDVMGIGLNNLKSRVEYLNSKLDIVSNSQGTFNTIEIDLNKINAN